MSSAPQFSIQQKGGSSGSSVRVKLSLPHDDRFRVRSLIANVKAVEADDLYVDVEVEADGVIRVLLKTRMVDGERRDMVCGELAELTLISGDSAEKDPFVARLANQLDHAFADAVFAMGEVPALSVDIGAPAPAYAGVPIGAPVQQSEARDAQGMRVFIPASAKAWLLTAVVACALGLIAVGVVRQVHGSGQTDDSSGASIAGPSDALEANVRAQIDRAVRDPNGTQGYNGMNVALATMKAMGLNPGKANAGCLVGLGKK
jgi:hypothetical protein